MAMSLNMNAVKLVSIRKVALLSTTTNVVLSLSMVMLDVIVLDLLKPSASFSAQPKPNLENTTLHRKK